MWREKASHEALQDGSITIDSKVFGKWSIEKKNDMISVEPYKGKVQYELPGYTVYSFLFGTLPPQEIMKIR